MADPCCDKIRVSHGQVGCNGSNPARVTFSVLSSFFRRLENELKSL